MIHQTHDDVLRRLKRAAGHLQHTISMIETGRPCPEVAQQLHAVSKAIQQAKKIFIHDHIDHCLNDSIGKSAHRKSLIVEFKEISKYL